MTVSVFSAVARPFRAVGRVVGYLRSSGEDLRGVYGDDPNGVRDPVNVAGNVIANGVGGFAGR